MFIRKTKMAAGSRSLWSGFIQRPVVVSRSNFALCYRTNQLRLRSSEALEYTARKGLFQRRGFWLFFGGSTVLGFTAYYNRLWEARQRRRLRVSVEGVGRFFRQVKILEKSWLFLSKRAIVNWSIYMHLDKPGERGWGWKGGGGLREVRGEAGERGSMPWK